jgi:pyrimidine operon attenuation protein / uracil phosphoribosyltransferase
LPQNRLLSSSAGALSAAGARSTSSAGALSAAGARSTSSAGALSAAGARSTSSGGGLSGAGAGSDSVTAGGASSSAGSSSTGNGKSSGGGPPDRTLLDDRAIRRALMRIAHEIVETTDHPEHLYLVAIPNGGVPLGRILVENLESLTDRRVPLGILDTTLYRDDLSTRGSRPPLRRTEMPSSVDDRIVILVEDVVNTGRTIRAAMDALMDFGRPSQVRVVALVDRGHRELPIKIDYVGKNIPTRPNEKIVFMAANEAVGATDASSLDAFAQAEEVGLLELVVRGGGGES